MDGCNVSTFNLGKPINTTEMAAVVQVLHPPNEQRSLGITSPRGLGEDSDWSMASHEFTMAKERAPPDEHNQTKVSAAKWACPAKFLPDGLRVAFEVRRGKNEATVEPTPGTS